jgi:hypothetical protein
LDSKQQSPRKRGVNLRLFAHIEDLAERQALMSAWEGSSVLFDKTIRKIIEDKLKESYDSIDNENVYQLNDRVGYLADQSGYRRALKELITLLP